MQGLRRSLFLITLPLATFGCLSSIDTAKGQIIPDNSLGAENSVVNSNANTDLIDGGARRGANLFHSFQEFNVGEGKRAYFSNPTGVENIISRVTGRNTSNIYGTLGVSGNANLFLINPNGIVFGQNARLDLRGSFLASTANSLVFENGVEFSATNPQAPPPLIVSIPIGLRFRGNPGNVTNQSGGVGLQVDSGKSLSLVGGDVNLEGGKLTAAGGRIELGGLVKAGTVALNSDGGLSFPDGVARSNVSLTNGAQIDVTARRGGNINIYAQDLDILENSAICAGIGAAPTCGKRASDFGSVGSKAGNVTLNTLNNLTINQGSQVENVVNMGAISDAGDITIKTKNLNLTNGARLNASTFGEGNAGTITIDADTVSFDGVGSTINDLGNTISIFTGALSRVEGKGNGGDINISTKNLNLTNGARLYVGIVPGGKGKAGTINITKADSVYFDGVGSNGFSSGAFSYVDKKATSSAAGSINITTNNLALTNYAKINATNFGQREEVGIYITGGNKNGSFPSESAIGKGGNIFLVVRDIFLSRGSTILSFGSFGSDQDTNTEGNIDIKVETLVLYERSHIRNRGGVSRGDIKIRRWHGKLVIFISNDSSISASGIVTVDPTLTVQPLEIPQVKLVEPTEQIAHNPCQRGVGTKFIITGRGGLPPSPNEATSSDSVRVDLVEPAPVGSTGAGEQKRRGAEEKTKSSFTKAIVPAQGWIFNKKGEVMLTAYDPTGTGSQRQLNSNACSVP